MVERVGLRAALRGKRVALAVTAAFLPYGEAYALPTGEQVVIPDSVTVTRPTAQTMQIDQAIQKAIVNWQGFSIGATEHVNITQPNAAAALLNRVVGNEASQIFGRLTANGQVFLVNNAGVLFAPGASVEVGSLLASSLSITDQNFLNGTYQFYNPGNAGSVTNAGSIITPGGYTALVGPQVQNDGVIIANAGKVALAAGNGVSLSIGDSLISVVVDEAAYGASVINRGTLQADGGTVLLKAKSMNALLDTVINTSGVIRATGLALQNGEIVLDGGGPNGGIVATGETQAGHVAISGGSLQVQRLVPDPMMLNGLIAGDTIDVNVAGGVLVERGGQVASRNGQTITADSLTIRAQAGELSVVRNDTGDQVVTATGPAGITVEAGPGGAAILSTLTGKQDLTVHGDLSVLGGSISTSGGEQTITVNGGSIDVRAVAPGSGAFISTFNGKQSISVTDGDHIRIVGEGGSAGIQASFGDQSVSITGSGANALQIGSESATGFSVLTGANQRITAGGDGESGSITIQGAGADGQATFIANVGLTPATRQVISTSGTLSIKGGGAGQNRAAGIFQNSLDQQEISAAEVILQGGAGGSNNGAFINSTFGGGQLFNVDGRLKLAATAAGAAGMFNGTNSPDTISGAQAINAGSVVMEGGSGGTNNSAFISSQFGGAQTLKVPGEIRVTGGAGGANNRAGILTNAAQTITGNPEIVLKGGEGGTGNNVFIQATSGDVAKPQTINARRIELRSGTGIDASATLNAARNVVTTTGDVSIYGGAGGGGSNGARIGGIGGTTLGPTNLTLSVGTDLLVHGGTVNGASLGSSGPSTQSNTITVSAANVTLESEGAGARIGASNQTPVPTGSITVTATGDLDVGAGTAIRANGPITLTASSLTNDGTITNGGGTNTGNVALIANAFDLSGGSVQGGNAAVILRPRDGTRSFGIGAAGDTTLTNADLQTINTTNFVVLGSGTGLNFTGDMTIGQNARVDGGTKGLAFFRSVDPAARTGTITIGAQGVTTAGGADIIVGAGKGNIVSAGGMISGDEVQLRASTGIGADGARVHTSANALAINNSSGAVFVSEADDVTLRNISLVVGGNVNNFGNVMGGTLDLRAGGSLGVTDVVSSFGGQTITAQNVNVSAQGGRTAQLLNTVGDQSITAGNIDVQTGAGGGVAEIRNNSAGQQQITVTGDHLNIHGLGGGVANVFSAGNQLIQTTGLGARRITLGSDAALGASTINAGGDQTITGRADISLTGGAGPVQDGHNAIISAFNPTRTQRIEAGDLTLANSTLGGNNSVAAILGANQLIDATGDVTLTANASAGSLPGVRIGGLGGGGASATGTNLTLTLDGDLVLTGGTLSGNGVGIGSTASPTAPALANNITINAPNGNVILNSGVAGSGVRIGAPQTDGGIQSGGNIALTAGGDIRLNGDQEFASIRTRDSVTLHAASITEAQKGRVLAGSLTVNTAGSALMSGPNEVASFKATSTGGDVTLNNSGVLTVTGMNAFGDATIANVGNVTVSGPWTAGGTSAITVGSDIVLASSLSSDQVILTANGGSITESGGAIVADRLTTVSSADTTLNGANQVATFSATSTGGDVTLNNSGVLEVTGVNAFGDATIANFGDMAVSGSWSSTASTSITTAGDLNVTSSVSSFGPMHVSVDGTLTVAASGTQPPPPPPTPDFPPFPPAPQFATLTSNAGQDIAAGSIQVLASDGANASINNQSAGSQTITVTGGRLDVHTSSAAGQPSSSAQIGNFTSGEQIVKVIDGAGIDVSGVSGSASISASGAQTVSTTGSSANALTLGAAGNLGSSWISGATQVITAGTGNQAGSITVVGADVGPTFISSGQVVGGTQTVSTSGTLRISGGNVPNQPGFGSASGLYHNGSGEQKVSAAKLEMKGGATGMNNTAIIISSGGAGTIAAGDQVIDVGAGSVELTGGGSGTTNSAIIVSSAGQTVTAGSVSLQGGEAGTANGAFINSTFGHGQRFDVSGQVSVHGGAGGAASINNGSNSPLTMNGAQTINAGSVLLEGGPGGVNNGAFINSGFGGNQTLTVTGDLKITGGDGGAGNRAGIVTNANQTINGNPDIVLKGGAGGAANNSNNVFIQATGPDSTVQTINARSIELRSGAGIDASATFNAARNVITTIGDVSIYGGAGQGGSNGARIGGIGGTTLGPTNLTLNAGGNLLVHGGTVNGASLGSSGPSTQSNTITVSAANVTLESEGAGARIGASNQTPVPAGQINVTASGNLQVGAGTAIRANGAITLTANSLKNDGTITNGGGIANVVLNANAFDLDAGNIQGGNAAVVLRPRTGTNSFGIESAGDTTLTNADLASINTANFVVLGSGLGTTFTGDMTIGQNARVEGGTKSLAFFRSSDPLARIGTITIGAQGVTTGAGADVVVGAGNGSIIGGGTISADEVQLRASRGIGADGTPVKTSANALAINNSFGGAYVSETDGVDLRTITLNVGGMSNVTSNFTGGSLELAAGGAANVIDSVTSNGGQKISAQSLNVAAQGGRLVQLLNNGGTQTIIAGSIDVQTGAGGGVAEIRNNSAGQQQITVTGDHLNIHGLGGGVANVFASGNQLIQTTSAGPRSITLGSEAALGASTINAGGDQTITGRPDIFLTGGSGFIQDGHNALIVAFNPLRTQHIEAGNLTLANSSLGGNNSVAAILGANQLIDATGDVTLTANASLGSLPGVRIGGLGGGGGSATGTNLTLILDGDLVLTGGTLSGNGVGIGSTASPTAPALANFITIDAGGSVVLDTRAAGAGARIGAPQTDGGIQSGGNIAITAGGDIRLNGVQEFASIRTRDNVTLSAASITEAQMGRVIAGSLSVDTVGSALLSGPNELAVFNATSTGGDVTLNNTGALNVAGMSAFGDATIVNAGNVTVSGPWTAGGTSAITVGSDIVLASSLSSDEVILTASGGSITESAGSIEADRLTTVSTNATSLGGENRVGSYSGTAGSDLFFFNRGDLEVTSLNAASASLSNNGAVAISGPWITSGQTNITAFGFGASLSESAGGSIEANGFNSLSGQGSVSLNGANRIAGTLNGSSMEGDFRLTNTGDLNFGAFAFSGDVNLVNAGALNVTSLNGRDVSVTNSGPMSVTGFWASQAGTTITTVGDLTVSNSVSSNGPMTVNVDGALIVTAGTAQPFVNLTSNAGQDITAKSMRVSAENGGFVFINNQGTGNQNITVTGGDLSLLASGDGFSAVPASTVQVFNFGNGLQTVDVSGALIVAARGIQPPPPPPPGIPPVPPSPGVPAASPAPQFAILGASSGQHITAHAVAVTAEDGAQASINNQSNQTPFSSGTPGGNQTVVVSGGGITIRSSGGAPSGGQGSSSAQIVNSSFGDQASTGDQLITVSGGGSIDVLSTGGFASISNSAFNSSGLAKPGGSQTVAVSGGGNVDVQSAALSGGAFISQSAVGASQSVSITDGQRLKVNGSIGNASIGANGGTQTVSVTGSGANAIELGSAGALGFSLIGGGSSQEITAGTRTEQGSIMIVGPSTNLNAATLSTRPTSAGTQKVSTTGLLSITGGSAPSQTFVTGLLHAGGGQQTVEAGSVELRGGPTAGTSGNTAFILLSSNTPAGVSGNQLIDVKGDFTIAGGVGGDALVHGSVAGKQTIYASDIAVSNAVGGANSAGAIRAGHQEIHASGDMRLTAGATEGTNGTVRVGGLTATTDLQLYVGGDLTLRGSDDRADNPANIGSGGTSTAPNNIFVDVGGDVILQAGERSGVRIGAPADGTGTPLGGGLVEVHAGGDIRLIGTATQNASIRSLETVKLDAANINQTGARGHIFAGALELDAGTANLGGDNRISNLDADIAGSLALRNIVPLNVTSMTAGGDAAITNLGDVTVSGPWTAGGTSTITVGSSIFLKSHMQSHDVQLVSTTGDIVQDAGASIDAVNLTTSSFGDTQLAGTNTVETVVSDAGGDLSLHTVSALLKLSGIHLPGMLTVDNTGAIAVTGEVSALSHDLHATGDITIGGADAPGATLLHAPGFITISTPGSIWVRGSDTSAGAGSAVLAGGALSLNASNVTLLGGGAALTPVLARGDVVNMAVGNLNVMGGRGHLSPAWLSSGTDINLTVGDAVRLQTGSGLLSWARVQTETRDGEIRLTFPSRSEGGYFVDGIEDSVKHGQTGFYTLLKPVKVGDTLILTYEGE